MNWQKCPACGGEEFFEYTRGRYAQEGVRVDYNGVLNYDDAGNIWPADDYIDGGHLKCSCCGKYFKINEQGDLVEVFGHPNPKIGTIPVRMVEVIDRSEKMRVGYTPGPWRIEGTKILGNQVFVEATDFEDAIPVTVIDCYGGMGGDDTEADKRLISAAPRMYEALKEADELILKLTGRRSFAVQLALEQAEGLNEGNRDKILRADLP